MGVTREISVINRMMKINETKLKKATLITKSRRYRCFAEGIDSPRRVSILYDRTKNLDKKVNEIHLLPQLRMMSRLKALSS